jgi:hypothetical protein
VLEADDVRQQIPACQILTGQNRHSAPFGGAMSRVDRIASFVDRARDDIDRSRTCPLGRRQRPIPSIEAPMKVYAQGDVVLVAVRNIEPDPKSVIAPFGDTVVLAEGELTGHRHAFYGGAMLFRDDAMARDVPRELYIGHVNVAPEGALLEHGVGPGVKGDHDPIKLPSGTYVARRQREYVEIGNSYVWD